MKQIVCLRQEVVICSLACFPSRGKLESVMKKHCRTWRLCILHRPYKGPVILTVRNDKHTSQHIVDVVCKRKCSYEPSLPLDDCFYGLGGI